MDGASGRSGLDRLFARRVEEPMPLRQVVAYSLPYLPLSAIGLPLGIYLPAFYATDLGIGLATLGAILMISRFWDIFTDPVIGMLGDRYPSRYGRRRHWLLASVPLMMLGAVLVFMPRYLVGDTATPSYLLGALLLLYLGYTLSVLSHVAWGAELSSNYNERSRIQGWREWIHHVGYLIAMGIAAVVETTGDASSHGLKLELIGWFMVITLPITTLIATASVGERPARAIPRLPLRTAFALLLKNKLVIRIVIADILVVTPISISAVLFVFFVQHIIQRPEIVSLSLVLFFALSLVSVPIWIRISARIGKHKAVALITIIQGLNFLALLRLGPGDVFGFMMFQVIGAFSQGSAAFLLRSILADIVDADEVETGVQRTGLLYSLMAVSTKAAPAIAVGLIYPALELAGFDPSSETNPENALFALRLLFAVSPVIPMTIGGLLLYNFPLDEARQRELRARIEERGREPGAD